MTARKKLTVAGMFLWRVEIQYNGLSFTGPDRRTLIVTTRHKTLTEAHKKALAHLRAFRYDYPKAKIDGITYHGHIDA